MEPNDSRAVVVMWQADVIGARLRLWTYDERDRLVDSADLALEEEFLEEMLSHVRAAQAEASQPTLW